jgi:biotin operon repressor
MGADLASLGGRGLLLVQRLWEAGGQLSGADAAAALGCNRATLSRLVSRLVDAGVCTQPERGEIKLLDDWADTLEVSVKAMPSYGMYAARRAAYLDTRIARLDDAMLEAVRAGDADPAAVPAAQAAVDRLQTALDEAEGERCALDIWAEGLPDTQRRRILTRHGTWDARRVAEQSARRLERQRTRDTRDTRLELERQQAADAAAGVTPAERLRADVLYAAHLRGAA